MSQIHTAAPDRTRSFSMSRTAAASTFAVAIFLAGCGDPPAVAAPTPPQVQAAVINAEDVPLVKTFVGRTVARQTVDIKANVTGYLLERNFTEGGLVKKGDVLFKIDPREFEANLETAHAREAQAAARLAQADIDLKRIEPLAKAGAAPQQELDNARTSQLSAQADLRSAKATVAAAEISLSYTTIAAPFAGRVGKATVDPGTLVSPSTGVLATLDQIDPIAVEFTVSEQEILLHKARIADGSVTSPVATSILVEVQLLNGAKAKEPGRIDFADIRIRPETGTALLRAVMPNAESMLYPGQFVRVSLMGMTRKHVLLVPQKAVIQSPTGASVYVVAGDGTLESRSIVPGEWMDGRWIVESGLKPGERVVVGGVQKARAGAKAEIVPEAKDEAKPAADAKPAEGQAKP